MAELSHIDPSGAAAMVNVGDKPVTQRTALAEAIVECRTETRQLIETNSAKKGDVLAAARLAGIMAAKRTAELIPLCHSLQLTQVGVEFSWIGPRQLQVQATAVTVDRTGVEMEALVAASIAALTIYDMCKSADREMTITRTRLLQKSGGQSGDFTRTGDAN